MAPIAIVILVAACIAKPIATLVEVRRRVMVDTTLPPHELEDVFITTVGRADSVFGEWALCRTSDTRTGDPLLVAEGKRGAISLAIDNAPHGTVAQIWISRYQVRYGVFPLKTGSLRRRLNAFQREILRRDAAALAKQ